MSENQVTYDLVVVGASISGAYLSYLLGKKGTRVLIIEANKEERKRACGEGLSYLGLNYLKHSGLWTEELEKVSHPFFGYKIRLENGHLISLEDMREPLGVGVSRELLDKHVLDKALSCSTVQIQYDRVLSYTQDYQKGRSYWTIQCQGGRSVQTKTLAISCGHEWRELPDSQSSAREKRYGISFLAKGFWNSELPRHVMIYHMKEGEYILTPLGDRKVNVSVLLSRSYRKKVTQEEVRKRGLEILREAGFCVLSSSCHRGAAAIHNARRVSISKGPYFIGDTVERFDPIGGMGMTHGLYSASLAAQSILQEIVEGTSQVLSYEQRRRSGASILGLLTSLSYTLNVKRALPVRIFARLFPRSVVMFLQCLKRRFPEFSVVSDNNHESIRPCSSSPSMPLMESAR